MRNIISLFADKHLHPNDTPTCCPCQKRQFSEDIVEKFWPKEEFPGIKRYFIYPWGPNTEAKVYRFLECHLKPGELEPVEDKYKLRGLVWGEKAGFGRREKDLMDPDIEEFHPCKCP
ncbi:hypothetical protein F5B19DRAFT_503456 [Rostrohypoxylon terebratum]|nr:hypothetical protein F5B19DRAFT_503456 [Rostrohypoxylon terebratum]